MTDAGEVVAMMDMDGGGGGMTMLMRMQMTFKNTHKVTLLFDGLKIETPSQYAASLVIIFLICIVFQYARSFSALVVRKIHRKFRERHSDNHDSELGLTQHGEVDKNFEYYTPKRAVMLIKMLSVIFHTAIYMLAYGIMLLTMTFNVGVFMTICIGLAVGYVIFQDVEEDQKKKEVCH